MSNLIEVQEVTKTYTRGSEKVRAIRGISAQVEAGEFVAVTGPSGSGKTTFLQLIGCMDRPTSGRISIKGEEVSALSDKSLTRFRAKTIGFVFQQFFLVPTLTALENVELPGLFSRNKEMEKRAKELLERVGLGNRIHHRPSELSGGEMQRVAVARALVNEPKLLLADEPTGNLDSENAGIILNLFQELHKQGLTIVMVTHNEDLSASAQRIIRLKDGEIHPSK